MKLPEMSQIQPIQPSPQYRNPVNGTGTPSPMPVPTAMPSTIPQSWNGGAVGAAARAAMSPIWGARQGPGAQPMQQQNPSAIPQLPSLLAALKGKMGGTPPTSPAAPPQQPMLAKMPGFAAQPNPQPNVTY